MLVVEENSKWYKKFQIVIMALSLPLLNWKTEIPRKFLPILASVLPTPYREVRRLGVESGIVTNAFIPNGIGN